MKKNEFISAVADQTELSKADVERVITATFETITNQLQTGDKINIYGFGTFKVSERAARTGRNPKTGEAIQIAARKVASFKPSTSLKETINN